MKFKEYLSEDLEKTVIGHIINSYEVTAETQKQMWSGQFECGGLKLTSLKGCPKSVNGHFDCSDNLLTSLAGCPSKINGSFFGNNNKLTSLKGGPSEVENSYVIENNKLSSLKGCPSKVGGNFWCDNNRLTSLEGCPSDIGGNFWCENNKLKSLKDIHKFIKRLDGKFDCNNNPIKSHVLGLLLIRELHTIDSNSLWGNILNKHLGKGRAGVLAAQVELIEAGLAEYAKL